jgi:hypothetical protein
VMRADTIRLIGAAGAYGDGACMSLESCKL